MYLCIPFCERAEGKAKKRKEADGIWVRLKGSEGI